MIVAGRDGTELYIKRAGSGPPCLYVHGGPGAWSHNFEALGGNALESFLQMVYVDQRGCGRSANPPNDDFRLLSVVDDFESVRKALGQEKWIVLAHSFGAILAIHYAHRFPERVSALILMNATLDMNSSLQHQTKRGKELLSQLGVDIQTDDASTLDAWNQVASELVRRDLFYQLQYVHKESFLRSRQVDSLLTGDQAFAKHAFRLPEYFEDHRPLCASIHVPTLIIAGTHDDAIGPDHHQHFAFPNKRVVKIEGRHVPYQESPAAFEQAVSGFVDSLQPART